ncbi:MAG: hypothetical protein NTV48_03310 [Candidatus Vogelbacteria bacterium]|nr:hypothetical protein [Candidatus Vogelbacteria bacterium]
MEKDIIIEKWRESKNKIEEMFANNYNEEWPEQARQVDPEEVRRYYEHGLIIIGSRKLFSFIDTAEKFLLESEKLIKDELEKWREDLDHETTLLI